MHAWNNRCQVKVDSQQCKVRVTHIFSRECCSTCESQLLINRQWAFLITIIGTGAGVTVPCTFSTVSLCAADYSSSSSKQPKMSSCNKNFSLLFGAVFFFRRLVCCRGLGTQTFHRTDLHRDHTHARTHDSNELCRFRPCTSQ